MGAVLVFAEQREGALKKSVLELLGLARDLAAGGAVQALVIGKGIGAVAEEIGRHGADAVWTIDDPSLEHAVPELYVRQIAAAIEKGKPELVLFPASAMGRDLAPRVAARGGYALLTECMGLKRDGGFEARKSMYGGKVFGTWKTPAGTTAVATVRPGAHAPAAVSNGAAKAEALPLAAGPAPRARITGIERGAGEVVDLQEAEIVVSGGRGLRGPEHFSLIEDLAKALGGAVGASRAVVDAGWIEHQHQVGQTGVTVTPKLYVACGISGAIQHLAGMRSSSCIVAVNKDPDAPIFKAADYGIVGDLFEVLPALTAEIKKVKAS